MVSVAILAGGQSRRMGRDKAFLPVGGRPVIERILTRVKPLSDDVLINTNSAPLYEQFGLRIVADIYPDKAALGGIYSALVSARHFYVLVVACDMPFLNGDLLRYLVNLAPSADAVIPVIKPAQPEMLHAVYSKNCLAAIQSRLLADRLQIIGFLDDVSVRYVEQNTIAKFDPHFHSFINLNTPTDWQKAQKMAQTLPGMT